MSFHRTLNLPPFQQILPKNNAKSVAWKFFGQPADEKGSILSTDVAVCSICKTPVSSKGGSTSNLMSHLKLHHPLKYSELPRSHAMPILATNVDEPLGICESGNSQQTGHSNNESQRVIKRQKTMKDFQPLDINSANRCTEYVTKFIAFTMQAYNIVQQQPFINMVKMLNPRYKLPGRKHFSNTAIPKLYNDTKEKIRQELTKISDTPISITTDCWTSVANVPYIGVTAHFISSDWTLKSICLACTHFEDHNHKNIAEVLKNILSEWGIDLEQISACTTDNGSNIIKAIEELKLSHISCFGHNINIGVNRALQLPELKKAVSRLKKLQNTIAHSWKMKRDLAKAQELLKLDIKSLPTSCPTRWWSTLKLASRFLENQLAICKLLLEYPDKKYLMLEGKEVEALQDFKSATSLLEDISNTLSGEDYTSSSSILPLYGQIKENLQPNEDDSILKIKIKEEILNSLTKYEAEPLASVLKLSSLCDPRFRLDYIDSAEEVKRIAIEMMINIYKKRGDKHNSETRHEKPQEKKNKGLGKFLKKRQENVDVDFARLAEVELSNYMSMPGIDFDENPLQWWKSHEASFPTLKNIARHYLSIQGSSVPSERVFSTGGNVINKKRALLSPKNAEMQIFLAHNSKFSL